MWGIIPAAGVGSRIQPLAFSKELLPVGSRLDGDVERPRAVSEYLIERMVEAGVTKICIVIAPGKSDILEYFGGAVGGAQLAYVVQSQPGGLCDAIFCALPLIGDGETVVVGLPDTVWFPVAALKGVCAPGPPLSFLCFPVDHPELFDAVVSAPSSDGATRRVQEIQVKRAAPDTHWVWGAFAMTSKTMRELHALWLERDRSDPYVGTLVNAWLARGGRAEAVHAGEAYVDVGTLGGYREAIKLLSSRARGA